MQQILNFINGEFVATRQRFEKRTPVDNTVIGQVHEAGKAEVDAAVQAARAALQGPWGRMTVAERTDRRRMRRYRQTEKPRFAHRHSARCRQFQDFCRRNQERADRIL
jgi:acyl-CoA reductase-like NAD-dependent aldehyde dehydrogenase